MGEIQHTDISGFICDARGCNSRWQSERISWTPANSSHYQRAAAAIGWRFFAGRTRYAYCPEHGPSKRSRMFEITPEED